MGSLHCRELDGFRYHALDDPECITAFVRRRLRAEWVVDHREFPDQPWTVEWLAGLDRLSFGLVVMPLDRIRVRPDLLAYEREGYSFAGSLRRRAEAMRVAIESGASIEPLLVRGSDNELMDGHARYTALRLLDARRVYLYAGAVVSK